MSTGEFTAGVTLQWTSIPSRGGLEILLAVSCCRDWDKLWPDGPLGSTAGLTFMATLNLLLHVCNYIVFTFYRFFTGVRVK